MWVKRSTCNTTLDVLLRLAHVTIDSGSGLVNFHSGSNWMVTALVCNVSFKGSPMAETIHVKEEKKYNVPTPE